MKYNNAEREVLGRLAAFYIEKHNKNYDEAIAEVERLGIRRIEVCGELVVIWVKRAGLFIGRHCENIDPLMKCLGKKLYIKEIDGEAEDSIICAIADERDMDIQHYAMPFKDDWRLEQEHYEESERSEL